MYNKIVVTVFLLALASAGHAQYHSVNYVPISYAYANAQYAAPGVNAQANYLSQRYATVFQQPSVSAALNFAYMQNQFRPNFGSTPSLGSVNLAYQPAYIQPNFGSGSSLGSVNLAYQPAYIQPNFGSSGNFAGSLNFNLPRHELPVSPGFSFGNIDLNFHRTVFIEPIYATPSRALLNTQIGFGTYYNPAIFDP